MVNWLLLLIAVPALAGAVLLVLGRRLPVGWTRAATTAVSALAFCAALALLPFADQRLDLGTEWLPGLGQLSLDLSLTAVSALAVTLGTMWLALVAAWPDQPSRFANGILLLSLPAAAVAFLAGHWLLRYAALEAVVLVAALTVLLVPLHRLRWSLVVYLLLHIGDAGLLVAILALFAAGGTLDITRSLEVAQGLGAPQLGLIVAGLLLAVWVKLGGWPFHAWMQAGRRSPLFTQTWLSAILLPNLALYLLYRAAPLLPMVPALQRAVLWIGAGGAALAAALALAHPDRRTGLLYMVAAGGGLVVVASAAGKTAVWLSLLATTPLRLLLHLACARGAQAPFRRAALILGGAALAGWGVLAVSWAREVGAPSAVCMVGEGAAGLIGAWAVSTAWQHQVQIAGDRRVRHWAPSTVATFIGVGIIGGTAALRPLLDFLIAAGHGTLPVAHSLPALVHYIAHAPTFWITVPVMAAVALRLRWGEAGGPARADMVLDQERSILAVAHLVLRGVAILRRAVEGVLSAGLIHGLARGVSAMAETVYTLLERSRLEGLPAQVGSTALALGRRAQSWHSGRLRQRLLWLAAMLVIGVLAVLLGE